ncbi:hypothetical protein EZY14_002645 [Kordia sp. TARA_039_SRF]|nr:hypothetical protein EZY14_002645 [Kordia sp. TARA_039_SRF]
MTKTISVNNQQIIITKIGTTDYVAVKPICEAIGVSYPRQFKKLKESTIIGSTVAEKAIVASDGNTRKMIVIPLRYVFGWLFTINENKVDPSIKDQVINYKRQCYDALFDTFTSRSKILKERTEYQIEIDKLEASLEEDERYKKIKELKSNIKNASQRLNNIDKEQINAQYDIFQGQQ